MCLTNDEYFNLENLVTFMFNIGISIFCFMPPYFFCHGNGHVITTCPYHSTLLLITTSLSTFVESSLQMFPQLPTHNISQSQLVLN
jgi:hypothetical protein